MIRLRHGWTSTLGWRHLRRGLSWCFWLIWAVWAGGMLGITLLALAGKLAGR